MFVPLQFNKGNLQRLVLNLTGIVNTWSAGTTGLTPAAASTGNIVLGGVLNVANGGTGVTTSTGTGSVVLNTSATLVTPAIGVATGTSLVTTGNLETGAFAIIGRNLSPTVGGSTAYAANFFNATAIGVYTGTGSPTISAARGSLYLRNEGLPYYNTNGTTGWSPIAGFTTTKVTVFTNSGTWFVDPRTFAAQMEAWGGGGGGGGTATGVATSGAAGAGGGAGSYSRTTSLKATIGTSQVVTIGALGTGGSAGNNPGNPGGDTSIGSLCIGKGGSGGAGSAGTAGSLSAGGLGGVAGTGDITSTGMAGGSTVTITGSTSVDFGGASFGGSSLVGGGARAVFTATTATGEAGTGHASGGSGGASWSSSGTAAGGAGTTGYVVITEYLAT